MKVGGERILQIPSDLGYGEAGSGEVIGPDTDLVFRVHLLEIVEAPLAHTLMFDGDAPTQPQVETLTEGTGDGAEPGDIVFTNIAVLYFNSNALVQSTWESGQPVELALVEGALIPGLNDGVLGIKVGEIRQVTLPADVVYPDGLPPNAGLDPNDALVFVLEPVAVVPGG
jgi:FKBP-type peptidyl-prolyl cis-trans isomerase